MNRKWIYRAVATAAAFGGMLLFGAASANASTQVAGADQPAVLTTTGGVTHPVLTQHDPASQLGLSQPGVMHPDTVANESATAPEDLVPGVSTGQPPTNGTRVDAPKLIGAAGPVVQPVQQLAGPAAGPLSGLSGGGEAGGVADPNGLPVVGPLLSGATQQQPAAQQPSADDQTGPSDSNVGESAALLPNAAPVRVVPALATEDGFTIGQNNQLPTDGLVSKAGSGLGSTVGQLAGGPSLSGLPGGESATEGTSPVDGLTSGANVAGLPVSDVTSPVTSQLGGATGQEDSLLSGASSTAPTTDQPATSGAPGLGSDPISGVTGLVGGLGG